MDYKLTLEITTLLKHLSDEANKQKTISNLKKNFKKSIHTTTANHKTKEMLRDFFYARMNAKRIAKRKEPPALFFNFLLFHPLLYLSLSYFNACAASFLFQLRSSFFHSSQFFFVYFLMIEIHHNFFFTLFFTY